MYLSNKIQCEDVKIMKKNSENYSIYPLVVPAGKTSTIRIVSRNITGDDEPSINVLGRPVIGGTFKPGRKYTVEVFPREIGTVERAVLREMKIDYRIENGYLTFDYEFNEEQEYYIKVIETIEETDTLLALFKIYSLHEDLYSLTPLKGEIHMHSNWSDGKQPAEFMYAYARRAGMEFAALADHYQLQPAEPIRKKLSKINTGLKIFNGEEVHNKNHRMHIVSFGARECITKMLEERYDEIVEEAKKYLENHDPFPPDVNPLEYAVERWVFDEIRKQGGVGILAHPYWPNEKDAPYIPVTLSRLLMREGCADAWEITGVDDGDKDFLQGVLYSEERDRGCNMPVVGATDAHNNTRLGESYSIVFAADDSFESIASAIRNNLSVGARQITRADGVTRYMAYGPARLVRYAIFLMNEFYTLQDRLCFIEGELMLEALSGGAWANDLIGAIAEQISREKRFLFGKVTVKP